MKVVACQNHCSEFKVTKFFKVLALDEEITTEEVTTSVYDGYKFSLEKCSSRYIKFQVRNSS